MGRDLRSCNREKEDTGEDSLHGDNVGDELEMLLADFCFGEQGLDDGVCNCKPEGRNGGEQHRIAEVEGVLGHGGGQLQSGVDFMGVHVVVAMLLEPENHPTQILVLLRVP